MARNQHPHPTVKYISCTLAHALLNDATLSEHIARTLYGRHDWICNVGAMRLERIRGRSRVLARIIDFLLLLVACVLPALAILFSIVFSAGRLLCRSYGRGQNHTSNIAVMPFVSTRRNWLAVTCGLSEQEVLTIDARGLVRHPLKWSQSAKVPLIVSLAFWRILVENVSCKLKLNAVLAGARIVSYAMTSLFLASREGIVATDSHYNIAAFLGSHLSENFYVVQHGFIDSNIAFPFKFGKIEKLFVRNSTFLSAFSRYYSINNVAKYSKPFNNFRNSTPKGVLLLCSRPFLDKEIEFLDCMRQLGISPIRGVLHPNHFYSRQDILALSRYITAFESDIISRPKVVVSVRSFFNYDFEDAGCESYFITDFPASLDCARVVRESILSGESE